MAEKQEPQFAIQRIYLKDVSFETPAGIKVFTQKWEPRIQLDVNTRTDKVAEDSHEVVLRVTLTARQNDEALVLIEVEQAGIFVCKGLTEEQKRHVLSTRAPDILFPYLRETVDNLAVKGSFPPFMLAPMNFDALYKQALEKQGAQQPAH